MTQQMSLCRIRIRTQEADNRGQETEGRELQHSREATLDFYVKRIGAIQGSAMNCCGPRKESL